MEIVFVTSENSGVGGGACEIFDLFLGIDIC